MKKLTLIVACLLLISSILVSCKNEEHTEQTGVTESEEIIETEETDIPKDDESGYLKLCEGSEAYFDIIAAMPMSRTIDYNGNYHKPEFLPLTQQKYDFYNMLLSMMQLNIIAPNAPKILSAPSGKAERIDIYYGVSDDPETQRVLDSVQLNEYGYFVKDNKIFIYGHTMDELKQASAELVTELRINMVTNEDKTVTYRIPTTAERKITDKELPIMSVPKPECGDSELFCESGLKDERLWVFGGCDEDDFANYLNVLKEASFTEYETNEIVGNLYATYTKDDIIVDTWYTKDGYLRVNATKGYDARPLEAGEYNANVCEPGLYMLGKAVDNGGGQECLIFRLSDGRFAIVDSACPYNYIDNIIAVLKREAPDPNNIVIANWMFTHNHGDHIDGFIGMNQNIEKYRSILTVESFTYNFTNTEQSDVPWMLTRASKIPELVRMNFPDAKVYRALPGNTFKFADMEYEILASPEFYIYDVFPNDVNACNVYFRVTMGGQVINIPGDTCDFDHAKLVEVYGDYLKCDILQAPHHGGNGAGTVEAAIKYSPKYILYCHSSGIGDLYGWEDLKDTDYNLQLIDPAKNPNYQEHFLMTDLIYYFPLPYSTGEFVRYTWADFGM